MNTTDTINITRTTLTSRQADVLGRGKPIPVTEAEFRKLLGIALTLMSVEADSPLPAELGLAASQLGEWFATDDPTGAPDDYSLLGTLEQAIQHVDVNEVPEHMACPTCGERDMDHLDATIDGQYECDICNTIYSDEGKWKRLPSGLTLYAAGNRWMSVPGAQSPAVLR
jgi:rubredoxin